MDPLILRCGAVVSPQRRIANPKGDILHALKSSEASFNGFGEAYFSHVLHGVTKGWKLHREMTLNLVVPVGAIRFDLRSQDGSIAESVELGIENYARLTVPPCVWMAFTGVGEGTNLLLNVASLPHDPEESITVTLEEFELPGAK